MQLIQFHENTNIKNSIYNYKNNTKTIVFIEPYGGSLSLLKHGHKKGYNIIIVTANSDLRIVPNDIIACSVLAVQVDTTNDEQLKSLMESIAQDVSIDA